MRSVSRAFVVIAFITFSSSAFGGELCRTCIKDAVKDVKEKVLATAVLGALGGLKVGKYAGAVCGAVLGAVGQSVNKLIELSKCEVICRKEAAAERDPEATKCEALLSHR
jgi:hypothetical protein